MDYDAYLDLPNGRGYKIDLAATHGKPMFSMEVEHLSSCPETYGVDKNGKVLGGVVHYNNGLRTWCYVGIDNGEYYTSACWSREAQEELVKLAKAANMTCAEYVQEYLQRSNKAFVDAASK